MGAVFRELLARVVHFVSVEIRLDELAGKNYCAVYMNRPVALGEFEPVVLLAILRLKDEAYGVTICAEIAACTGREPSPGALYTTLTRMEGKGLVRSWLGEATSKRGGKAKRYVSVTRAGRDVLVNAQRAYQSLLQGLNLLGSADA